MKKVLVVCAALLMLLNCSIAFADEVDAVSTASTSYAFANNMLSGDDLMNAVNEKGGITAILTTCKDGTPNVGLFGYDVVKQDEQYIICVHMMTNQTSANIDNGSEVVILFADMDNAYDDEGRMLSVEGARVYVDVMENQEEVEKICADIGLKKLSDQSHLYRHVRRSGQGELAEHHGKGYRAAGHVWHGLQGIAARGQFPDGSIRSDGR